MNKDLLYYFDKLSPYQRHELGEIQSGFNMNFVIDGTKDSVKVVVWSFNETEIEPNTILWHEKTDSWWVIARDKVERHLNDNGDFIYLHNLQLQGAKELLNARDLTDCGFNQGTYTNAQFIQRLFKLSNFEFPVVFANPNNLFNQQVVSYVKTFENYTLLSALREFLDGYNMCAKLSFQTSYSDGKTYLYYARLLLVNKTGDNSLISHNISEFDDVRETKTIDRNSFGTTVISNAENVISSVAKKFPSVGSVRLSSTSWTISAANAIMRLPSKVFKGISLTAHLGLSFERGADSFIVVFPDNYKSLDNFINTFLEDARNTLSSGDYATFLNDWESKKDIVIDNIKKASRVTFYEGSYLNPAGINDDGNGNIIKGENVPYLANVRDTNQLPVEDIPVIFCDSEVKKSLPKPRQGISWQRGSNVINGFEGIDNFTIDDLMSTDLQEDNGGLFYSFSIGGRTISLQLHRPEQAQTSSIFEPLTSKHTTWSVVYIPMTDLKVKVDNQQEKRDIHLYNQNGKLTDNIALSKLLNSYSKEISSNKITRYKKYFDYNSVPKVGSFVTTPNGDYVVNNVSMDFAQNELSNNDFGYSIECEITMSKYCAAKSLMVNPNTNIRDYGIPQNFNVKRKQLYRDYYELGYSVDPNADQEAYLSPSKLFDLDEHPNEDANFICVVQLIYDEEIEGQYGWYYQLETTVYQMNKMLYVVCDFNDNNIIGYASQNVYSGFDITKVLNPSSWVQTVNTPISYVDSKGCFKDINICFCTNEEITRAYDAYRNTYEGQDDGSISLYNFSCFIPTYIYTYVNTVGCSFKIEETNYNKDTTEVPVFEYACQIEDSEDVLIGDNIFPSQKGNVIYMYSFVVGEHLNQNNVIANEHITYSSGSETATLENAAKITLLDETTMRVRLFEKRYYFADTMTFGDDTSVDFEQNKDYAIFRHTFDLTTNQETNVELVMIAKKVQPTLLNQVVDIIINHYKLN